MTVGPTKLNRVDELDGLRAILALWVVAAHMLSWCGFWEVRMPAHLQYVWSEFLGGHAAVEVFIILSGFAISFLLHARRQTYSEFIAGRFFRIYPVYLLCLVAGWASTYLEPALMQSASWRSTFYFGDIHLHYAAERAHMAAHWLAHLTLLNGLIPPSILPDAPNALLPPAWSITLEWQYYLAAPLIALLARSALGLAGLTALALVGQAWHSSAFLLTQLPLFLVGIGSYHFYSWIGRTGEPQNSLLGIAMTAVIGVALLSRWHLVPLIIWAFAFGGSMMRGLDGGVVGPFFSVIRRMLLQPVLQWLGRASYCIYLAHWPIIVALLYVFLRARPALSAHEALLGLTVIGLPIILAVTAFLHVCLELPAMKIGRTWGRQRREPKEAAS